MRNLLTVISLAICLTGCSHKTAHTPDKANAATTASPQPHETASRTPARSPSQNPYHLSSDQSQGWKIMNGSLKQVHRAVLDILTASKTDMISEGTDVVSGQINARLANNNYLTFDLAIVDSHSTKLYIRITGDYAPTSATQIEYLFKQVANQLEKNNDS